MRSVVAVKSDSDEVSQQGGMYLSFFELFCQFVVFNFILYLYLSLKHQGRVLFGWNAVL